MPSRSRKNVSYDRSEDTLPNLNPSSVQNLAQKIQDSFKQPVKVHSQSSVTKERNERIPKKSNSNGEPRDSDFRSRSAAKDRHKTQQPQAKSTILTGNEAAQAQGKKRLRDGQVKNLRTSGKAKASSAKSTEFGSRSSRQMTSHSEGLEGEVLALGGTADDLELLRDAASESEIDADSGLGGQSFDGGLNQELLQMVKGIGIKKARDSWLENIHSTDDESGDLGTEKTRSKQTQQSSKGKQNGIVDDSNRVYKRLDGAATQSLTPLPKSKIGGKIMLFIQPQAEWHSVAIPPLPESSTEPKPIPIDLLDRLHQHAKVLLEKENTIYATHYGSASTEQKFYSTLMSAGTLSDKISALTLSIQESPLHNVKALESLLNLARKRSRDQAVNVLGALKDLFGPGNLLPSDRRLRSFTNQPGLVAAFSPSISHAWTSSSPLPGSLREAHLIAFAFEDWLKSIYFEMLQILETWCNDEIIYARGKAVEYIASLLRDKPEQEANLLRLIVNKLGDSDRRVASKASFNILQLETSHPLMKSTIIAAIESDALFRPNQSLHAQYYAVITLNQTVLSAKEEALARKLLDIYFDLFANLLKRPDIMQEEANVHTTNSNKIVINKKGEIQGGGGPAGKKALQKQKAADKSTNVEQDLKEKMLSAILTGINRAVPFTTTNDDFFNKHMDTLYRITHSANFNTSVQALMLIQQINSINQGSQDRFYRVLYESLMDQRLLTSSKQALYLNLLFRALRSDLNPNRVKAFIKRLMQVIALHQPPLVCGVLYLVRELEKTFPALTVLIDKPEEGASDDEEFFRDIDDGDDGYLQASNRVISSAWKARKYDPRKRDPVHANASDSSLWELPAFLTHYHPSVSLFAKSLLSHDPMPPKPDLQQNTLISFLDRFVYKNPKGSSSAKTKGSSIMQPLSSVDDGAVLLPSASRATSAVQPVNSDAFWRQEDKDIGAHEVFFHKYFRAVKSNEEKKRAKRAKKTKGNRDDEDSGSDDEEEKAIWKALVDSRPEIEGDDSDVDMDFSDDEELADALGGEDLEISTMDEDSLSHDEDVNPNLYRDDELSDIGSKEDDELSNSTQSVERVKAREKKKSAKTGKEHDKKLTKRKLKGLPTFASADDFAKMLADGSDENEG